MIKRSVLLFGSLALWLGEIPTRFIGNTIFQIIGTITMAFTVIATLPLSHQVSLFITPAQTETTIAPVLTILLVWLTAPKAFLFFERKLSRNPF